MSTLDLGSTSFLVTPDVNGNPLLYTTGGVGSFYAAATASRPAPGNIGNIFIDTTLNLVEYDNGTSWITLGAISAVAGTPNQISVSTAANVATVSLANNPIIPGTGSLTLPVGTTAQRPTPPTAGMVRYNSSTNVNEQYNSAAAAWVPFGHVTQFFAANLAHISGTTQIAYGNTAPTITQGTQLFSQAITPTSTTSNVHVIFSGFCDFNYNSNNYSGITFSLFRGTTLVGVHFATVYITGDPVAFSMQFVDTPGTTASTTYSVRAGGAVPGTWYIGYASNATYGGALGASWSITEVQ